MTKNNWLRGYDCSHLKFIMFIPSLQPGDNDGSDYEYEYGMKTTHIIVTYRNNYCNINLSYRPLLWYPVIPADFFV